MPFPFLDVVIGVVLGMVLLINFPGVVKGVWKILKGDDSGLSDLMVQLVIVLGIAVVLCIYGIGRWLLSR